MALVTRVPFADERRAGKNYRAVSNIIAFGGEGHECVLLPGQF
jgi:hypothetical protein